MVDHIKTTNVVRDIITIIRTNKTKLTRPLRKIH